MKNQKLIVMTLCASFLFTGCASMSNQTKGMLIGGGGGAAAGAGIGALFGGGKGAAIGAAVGTVVGTGTGALIGNKMDKKKAELEAIKNAEVETIIDKNGLTAVKVTFEGGILFATNSSNLTDASRSALTEFAQKMYDMPDTDITVQGHTDKTGSYETNQRLSAARAASVANFISTRGINSSRVYKEGLAYDCPVADNSTVQGRAKNRRVEIYIYANQEMMRKAEAGELK